MRLFSFILSALILVGCAGLKPDINNMETGTIKFYIMKGFFVKETPGDWQYINSPIETPFVARTIDRNLTVYGTIIMREDWSKPRAKVQMISNNKTNRIGNWNVFNCETKTRDLEGTPIEKATFKNDSLIYIKGFILDEICGMINLKK